MKYDTVFIPRTYRSAPSVIEVAPNIHAHIHVADIGSVTLVILLISLVRILFVAVHDFPTPSY
jgi:hypothetical protein